MQFLCEQPTLSLSEGSKTDTFAVDLSQSRPDFDQIAAFHEWSTEAREKMQEAMGRKKCAVAWVALVVDDIGLMVVARFKHTLGLSDAKKAIGCILRCLPMPAEFRPLDELDKNRIAAWKTLADLRPKAPKR